MNKVEMTLESYNALMAELNYYKGIYDIITNPKIDQWDIDRLDSGSEAYISSADLLPALSREDKKRLISDIKKNVSDLMLEDHGMEVETDFGRNIELTLCTLKVPKESPKEEESVSLEGPCIKDFLEEF